MSILELSALSLGGLVALLTLIQIAPIKINPWGYIAKGLGKMLNADILDKVNNIAQQITEIDYNLEEAKAQSARARILRFGDELLHNIEHSKDYFDNILYDITKYELYCSEHPEFPNGKTEMTIKRIKNTYNKCFDENKFL